MVDLSPRLEQLSVFVPRGSIVADIGTDHAFLPIYLVQRGLVSRVIAGEINDGPYRLACQRVRERGLNAQIEVRKGDGLQILTPNEVDTAIIAGMGGRNIIDILCAYPGATDSICRFILQPMSEADVLRLWLSRHYFRIVDEALVREKGHIYEVIVAEHGLETSGGEAVVTLGPKLVANRHPLLSEHLDVLIRRRRSILAQMEKLANPTAPNYKRLRRLKTHLKQLEEIRKCL
ncbi:MAG: SAM-dependent methyltransferase [Firmicutes bacterium]|nr:SAM-dependent methyltransferase [Bacillota bacterium]